MEEKMTLTGIIDGEDTVVICGYGPVGRYLQQEIQEDGKERKIVFCDNNKAKQKIIRVSLSHFPAVARRCNETGKPGSSGVGLPGLPYFYRF